MASDLANPGRVNELSDNVAKSLTFFLSFILVYYVVATTLRGREPVMFVLKLIAIGGVIIGLCAIVEQRTGYNAFDHVDSVVPFLERVGPTVELDRGGNLRVFGPAQHPIALGAALIMILPIAVYFARTGRRRWWVGAVVLVLGALATGSRTAVVMLVAEIIVFLRLKPEETKRLWPALVPAIVVIHVFLPGQIGTFKDAFFPKGGLVAEQTRLAENANEELAGGRIRQLKPMISEASRHPFFGEGFGTRLTGFNTPKRNAPILDNQWLNNLLDVGYIGFSLWVWLFVRAVRRLFRESRGADDEGDQWLFAGLTAIDGRAPRRHAHLRRQQLRSGPVPFLDHPRAVGGPHPRERPRSAGQAERERPSASRARRGRAVRLCCLRRCRRTSSSASRSLRLAAAAR